MVAVAESLLKNSVNRRIGLFDLLPYDTLPEKAVELLLSGVPSGFGLAGKELAGIRKMLEQEDVSGLNVVVFGGGTGLSNLIGGDSKTAGWPRDPFSGLKKFFPKTRSVVCVTDDGGATGELLKDLPLVALGDLRRVLLSSIQEAELRRRYDLDDDGVAETVFVLHALFNYRFTNMPSRWEDLLRDAGVDLSVLPSSLAAGLSSLLAALPGSRMCTHHTGGEKCLGNLLLAAAVTKDSSDGDLSGGLAWLGNLIGVRPGAVLPCTTTQAQLKVLYSNGVMVSGEHKSAQAKRGCPVDRVFVEFSGEPRVPREVIDAISEADLLVFAPGSLYTSIIPILQVPGIADAIRAQQRAVKILVANLWVQKGETDLAFEVPSRRFYVSDLITAYHRNIPGGVAGLFDLVMSLGLKDIPGSILQNYALEEKRPIYLDRTAVSAMGLVPLEAKIYSQDDIADRRVLQHHPAAVAKAVKAVWLGRDFLDKVPGSRFAAVPPANGVRINPERRTLDRRIAEMGSRMAALAMDDPVRDRIMDILWRQTDIADRQLEYFAGVRLVDESDWHRSQKWDKVLSFYDPEDRTVKIRHDLFDDEERFERAFLVALGQSLLGNYAGKKENLPVLEAGEVVGKLYRLTLRPLSKRQCLFSQAELDRFLHLARMRRSEKDEMVYTRLVHGEEGFTPPGMYFGLTFAWYLDNRFSSHMEYKMALTISQVSELIPEQRKIRDRRRELIDYFRDVVFRYGEFR